MTSNNCTTDIVVPSMQWAKNKIPLCENLHKYQEGKKERKSKECIQPATSIFGLFLFSFVLRNVLHNMSQIGENKNCLGMFTVQWLDTGCTADPPTLEGRTRWSQLQTVSLFVPVRWFPVGCTSICWVTPHPSGMPPPAIGGSSTGGS